MKERRKRKKLPNTGRWEQWKYQTQMDCYGEEDEWKLRKQRGPIREQVIGESNEAVIITIIIKFFLKKVWQNTQWNVQNQFAGHATNIGSV